MTYRQLEESINKWTLELEEQEKIFLQQATQVNAWDRLLMENGEKVHLIFMYKIHANMISQATMQNHVDPPLHRSILGRVSVISCGPSSYNKHVEATQVKF